MATSMTMNGVSTCTQLGTEKHETFTVGFGKKKRKLIQYDYRHTDGELFSTVKPSLTQCREERDKWIEKKHNNHI